MSRDSNNWGVLEGEDGGYGSEGEGDRGSLLKKNKRPPGAVDPRYKQPRRRSAWYHTAFLIIGDVLGAGVLELPGNFRHMGWGMGIGSLVVFALIGWYLGDLIARIATFFPQALTFGDLAYPSTGVLGYKVAPATQRALPPFLCACCTLRQRCRSLPAPRVPHRAQVAHYMQHAYLVMTCGLYMLLASKTVQYLFYDTSPPLCQPMAGMLVVALFILPSQMRVLHNIAFLSVISFISVMLYIALCLEQMYEVPRASPQLAPRLSLNIRVLAQARKIVRTHAHTPAHA